MASPSPKPHIRRRETDRKRLLRESLEVNYRGQAVLLDELRWKVVGTQLADRTDEKARRSLLNSFARTVREQLTEHRIEKIAISPKTTVGLVARAAVFRITDGAAIRRFLDADESCILCRYITNLGVEEPRYRYAVPHHHAATFRFFESRSFKVTYDQLKGVTGTFVPATHKLTLIVPKRVNAELASIAKVPWRLFGCDDPSQWREVDGTDPLEMVQRNRRH